MTKKGNEIKVTLATSRPKWVRVSEHIKQEFKDEAFAKVQRAIDDKLFKPKGLKKTIEIRIRFGPVNGGLLVLPILGGWVCNDEDWFSERMDEGIVFKGSGRSRGEYHRIMSFTFSRDRLPSHQGEVL